MSELDLGLKIGARRLLWSMGYSTRLDVELRSESIAARGRRNSGKGGPESYTDLDVLGVLVTPTMNLSTVIADCKSGRRDKPTARVFWARGVADLFGANQVMLVREHDVNDGTRQLASRLGVTVLPSADLAAMQRLHGALSREAGDPLSCLFDREAVASYLSAFTGLDKRLNPLLEYRDFDYWVYDHHRNPIQMVAHLTEASAHLDSRNPIHLALFLDLAWLYLVAIIRVVEHVRGTFLHDQERGLQEYLFGGATNLREKEEIASIFRSFAPPGVANLNHLPSYYDSLRELSARLMRRPNELQTALRYAEVSSALMAARRQVTLKSVFGESFSAVASKLVADVCGFLVSASGLDSNFRTQARAWLLGEIPSSAQDTRRTLGPMPSSLGHGQSLEEQSMSLVDDEDAAAYLEGQQRTLDIELDNGK